MTENVMIRDWMNEREAAKYLGCSPDTLNRERCQKRLCIPYFRFGRHIRYRRRELDAWLEKTRVN